MKKKKMNYDAAFKLVLCIYIIIIFLFQYSFLPTFGILLPIISFIPITVSIAAFEYEFSSMFFGALCGILFDIASPITDGAAALFFTVFSCAAGLLFHYIMRNTLLSVYIINGFLSVIFVMFNTALCCIVKDTDSIREIILHSTIPSFFFTAISLPLFYYPIKFIKKFFRNKVKADEKRNK